MFYIYKRIPNYLFVLALFFLWQGCGPRGLHSNDADGCDGYDNPAQSKYILPFESGREVKVTQGNCSTYTHWGIGRYAYDFDLANGVPVHAARAGYVTEISVGSSQETVAGVDANFIRIKHIDGSVAEYVHLLQDSNRVQVGDFVDQGAVIAENGQSGTYAPHLHFIVWGNDQLKQTIPVVFRNAGKSHPTGLQTGEKYTAAAFTANAE